MNTERGREEGREGRREGGREGVRERGDSEVEGEGGGSAITYESWAVKLTMYYLSNGKVRN